MESVYRVAPFTGAWIETSRLGKGSKTLKSRPSRARGLKPACACFLTLGVWVAPFTGAWIETAKLVVENLTVESRPSRARGLKPKRRAVVL